MFNNVRLTQLHFVSSGTQRKQLLIIEVSNYIKPLS